MTHLLLLRVGRRVGRVCFGRGISRIGTRAGGRDTCFKRVRADLDHIQQVTPKLSTDQYRLVVVKKDLDELQGKMESKTYDQAALDRTITAVERVMNDNTLTGRDLTMLGDDVRRLREFREHHDGYR
jgi:hypothetical protein